MINWLQEIENGNTRSLARCISLIENESPGFETLLSALPASDTPVIGITGPPGAGKSSLTDALIGRLVKQEKKIAVICVDPSSPFNKGALLGDRIRLSEWYTHPSVFIRSMATRGSLGGLNAKIIETTDLLKAARFDCIIVETVGVGQSEIEIAGLADKTVVVLVPESGDEIQIMKSGIMEIADVFVVNKSDRPGAELFAKNLKILLAHQSNKKALAIPVIPTIAIEKKGIDELMDALFDPTHSVNSERKKHLLAEKAFQLLVHKKMAGISKNDLADEIGRHLANNDFNLYDFVATFSAKTQGT